MISAVKRVRNIRLVGPAWKNAKAALSPVAAPVATPTGTHGKAPGDER
jgi:hypothetical protein